MKQAFRNPKFESKKEKNWSIIDSSLVSDHSHARGWPTYQVYIPIVMGWVQSTAK